MRILALLILATVAPLSLAAGQDEQIPEFVRPQHILGDEASRLLKALESAPPIPIGFENADRSPLTIVGASASAVSYRRSGQSPTAAAAQTNYAVDARINLVNKTDQRIKG